METEFRAWHKKEKKMIYQNDYDSFHWFWITPKGTVYRDGKYQELELMQYTGMKDTSAEKQKIFQGDIVMIPNDKFSPDNGLPEYVLKEVVWRNFSWEVDGINIAEWSDDIIVISNIFEDPMLLNEVTEFKIINK